MTTNWDDLAKVTNIQSVITLAVGGLAVRVYDRHWVTSPSESLLKVCKEELDNVGERLDRLTPKQREEIHALTRQGKCKSLEQIEERYRRLLDHNDELCLRFADSSFLQRRMASSQLMVDIDALRLYIVALQNDTRNTTTTRMKESEASRLAQTRREQVEHQPPLPPRLPPSSPTAEPTRSQSTSASAQSSTMGPGLEEYPLDVIYPATAHTAARHYGATEVPIGLV